MIESGHPVDGGGRNVEVGAADICCHQTKLVKMPPRYRAVKSVGKLVESAAMAKDAKCTGKNGEDLFGWHGKKRKPADNGASQGAFRQMAPVKPRRIHFEHSCLRKPLPEKLGEIVAIFDRLF